MRNRDVQRAERGMWAGLIALILGGTLMFAAPVAAAISGVPELSILAMVVGIGLLALGGLSLLFKVIADRAGEQGGDRYSKDVDS